MYTSIIITSLTLLRGNTCRQVYINDLDYIYYYLIRECKKIHDILSQFFWDKGTPIHLIVDSTK